MKKTGALLLCLVLCLPLALFACSYQGKEKSDGILIVSTIFPGYDFARQVCGQSAEVVLLLPPGAESHSYEPSARDIITISECDLFIYVGGESESWIDDILASLDKPVKTLRMMDCVDLSLEEVKEGMEGGHEHEHEPEYDEHVWTSPANALRIFNAVAGALMEIDPQNAEVYAQNADVYAAKLEGLDGRFEEFFAGVSNRLLVFGDRFPLIYFTREYGLDYYAAFPGCASETEPSAATIAFLIDKVKEKNVGAVFYIELSNHLIADRIAEATGAKTARFNTCHNVTKAQLDAGATYLSLMEENLQTLREIMR